MVVEANFSYLTIILSLQLANVYFWNTYYRKKGLLERKRCFLPYEEAEGIVGKEEYEMLQELTGEEKE